MVECHSTMGNLPGESEATFDDVLVLVAHIRSCQQCVANLPGGDAGSCASPARRGHILVRIKPRELYENLGTCVDARRRKQVAVLLIKGKAVNVPLTVAAPYTPL
jgi:hypothetical protein